MTELLEVYDLKGKLLNVQERDKFYADSKAEFTQTGKISKKVKSVRILMMNSQGRIFLQKRSIQKKENPGLYDKSVGGHVPKEFTWDMTVIKECAEELGFPAAILSAAEFEKAVHVTDLSIIGLFRKVEEIPNFESVRITQSGERFTQPYISGMYIGYHDGAIRFIDGESSGIEVFSLSELKEEIKHTPAKFTEDIKFMVQRYGNLLKPIR